jgi:Protein of unknown function (DUF3443)
MQSSKKEISLRALALTGVLASLALASACGGGSGSSNNNNTNNQVIAGPGPNVATLTADEGPASLANLSPPAAYLNGSFVSVTVCVPGTSTCQTIDHMLVDTGSFGLRMLDNSSGGAFLRSQVPLVQETDSSNNPIGECVQFVDGSFFWGPVATADVKISSEVASAVPVHIVGDTTFNTAHPVPSDCSTGGTGTDADTLGILLANGIIGVGNLQQDCPGCAPGANSTPPPRSYYICPTTTCTNSFANLNLQVQNPVALFNTDNNGVIVELPAPSSSGATTLTGALVFGIGTQSNNALGSASVLTLDDVLDISTTYKGTAYPGSFIDSGSNAYFFLDSNTTGITGCSDVISFYCPSSTQNLTATNQGQNGTSTTVNFSVANADNLFNSSNVLFNNVGGPNTGSFDWGLPFFMGRNVFVSIAGKTAPGGTPPYVAY